ncbi:MAG: L-threonylcarbamoyladenylate synthase [Bryobacteraceae bacterium]
MLHPDLDRAVRLLRAGRLVAIPTETVYGLAANALDPVAVERLFAAKGRPHTSPLIVHVPSIEMARSLAADWPPSAQLLAERFWPGPLTIIVSKKPVIPDVVTAGLPTAGLRIPRHPVALDLLRAAGIPLAAPSANLFTQLSPTTAEHVRAGLGSRADLVLDGGPCQVGIESTVVSLAVNPPLLLRPGMIPRAEIEAIAGPISTPNSLVSTPGSLDRPGTPQPSPGMHPRHYSPRTPFYLFPMDPTPPGRGVTLRRSDMPSTPDAYAAALYPTLHRLDAEGWDWIAIEAPENTAAWTAILDRLQRAATPPRPY